MTFDFKITTWERVEVSKEHEEAVAKAIKEGKLTSSFDVVEFIAELRGESYFQRLDDCDEQMEVEENGGCSTIEIRTNNKTVWGNGNEEVELTPSQMIQQIQVKALQSGGTFTLANGGAVATSLGYVCEFGKEDVCMTDATYEDYGNFDDTDIENMYHAIF